MKKKSDLLGLFLLASCLLLCGCGGAGVPDLPEYHDSPPDGVYPYYVIWGANLFGFERKEKPASEWGISPKDLTQRGVVEHPALTAAEKKQGYKMAVYLDEGGTDGCPVWQDKEGRLYLEVRPGMYWRLRYAIFGDGTDREREELEAFCDMYNQKFAAAIE